MPNQEELLAEVAEMGLAIQETAATAATAALASLSASELKGLEALQAIKMVVDDSLDNYQGVVQVGYSNSFARRQLATSLSANIMTAGLVCLGYAGYLEWKRRKDKKKEEK